MIAALRPSAADRRLLLEGRLAGPMPWVIAIMMFLTALAVAGGVTTGGAARRLGAGLAGRLTVQIVEAEPDARERQARAALTALGGMPGVVSAERVPDAEVARLLAPWLGSAALGDNIPVPALIDVALAAGGSAAPVQAALARVAPAAHVDDDASSLAPLASLIRALAILAGALVALMAGATAAVVVLAARASLDTHRATINTMHLLGATDVQIARLFQRRIALDALFGGVPGVLLAAVVILVLGARIARVGSALLGTAGLPAAAWLLIAFLPLGAMLLAMLAARLTVLGALRRML